MAKPKILIFSLAYFPWVGGAEVAIKEITKRLPEYQFEIISADLNKRFWSKYLFPWQGYREACRRHAKEPYQLVWSVMANQAGMAGALFKRRFAAVPFLLTLQEGDDLNSWRYRLRLLGPKLFGVFKRADYLQAISHYLALWGRQAGAQCPVAVIPNGVDLAFFPRRAKAPNTIIKTIISTSRLVAKNGLADLIEALSFLPNNFRLQLIGSGPEEQELRNLARRLGVIPRVEFLGKQPYAELAGHLALADVFARPSLSEGLGNSFLEAMAVGVPVIGTPVGGIPDFLKEAETGWLVPVKNPQALAEKIKFILDPANQDEVKQVCDRAENLVRAKYDWQQVAAEMKTVFNQLMNQDPNKKTAR